jgi:ferredoxin
MLRIIVDRDLCEANAVCVGEAPEVFGLDDQNGMVVLDETPGPDRASEVRRAVHRCPRGALSIAEDR